MAEFRPRRPDSLRVLHASLRQLYEASAIVEAQNRNGQLPQGYELAALAIAVNGARRALGQVERA